MKESRHKTIGYIGQAIVLFASLYLFFYVGHDLSLYDIEYSDGYGDARWRVAGGLDEYEVYGLISWGIFLVSACTHILLYFWQYIKSIDGRKWWTLPTFNIGSSNAFLSAVSFTLSAFFLMMVVLLACVMPVVFMPSITYHEMKELHYGYPGFDSYEAAMITSCWMIVTLYSTFHLIVYGIITLLRKRNMKNISH